MVATATALVAMAAPSAASALTTRSATDTSPDVNGQLTATAACRSNEHVVSGGFRTSDQGFAVVSRAVGGRTWKVRAFPGDTDTLTTFAYCSKGRGVSRGTKKVPAQDSATDPTKVAAKCARGQSAVSGGYALLADPADQSNSPTFKSHRMGKRRWQASAFFDNPPAKLAAFAYCQRGVKVKVRSAQSDPIPTDGTGSATAHCQRSEKLLSGGYTTSPKSDFFNTTGPDLFYYRSSRSGPRDWTATAHNYSDIAGTITAFAYCKA